VKTALAKAPSMHSSALRTLDLAKQLRAERR
jgi:hypothetical protein